LVSGLKVLREYERAVVFRLGRLAGARGPGVIYIIPGVEKAVRIDLRTITMDVPSQDVITKDNVSLKVNAVLYFRVVEPSRAVVEVENYLFATSQNAQTTLRSVWPKRRPSWRGSRSRCSSAICRPSSRSPRRTTRRRSSPSRSTSCGHSSWARRPRNPSASVANGDAAMPAREDLRADQRQLHG